MWYIITLIAGAVIGGAITRVFIAKRKPVGDLRVDTSDPDGPFLFLALNSDQSPHSIMQRKTVILNVDVRDIISQK